MSDKQRTSLENQTAVVNVSIYAFVVSQHSAVIGRLSVLHTVSTGDTGSEARI
jgi:hypothetical protein